MADPKELIYDYRWDEVVTINSYALFMGYLSMAVRGMGFLVVTWTTVVLLGGFVSMLGKKDFWSLTIITLLQTAGAFNVVLNEKLSYIRHSIGGLAVSVRAMVVRKNGRSLPRVLIATVVLLVQLLVFAVILCPLAALYMCGLLITTGISLWRLIEHDYGGTADAANLKPALTVLYSLALFQGVLFCYRLVSSLARRRLLDTLAEKYRFEESGRASVKAYLRETRIGCAKDPSFAKGRNLVTYAVELMESKSLDSYRSGLRILDTLIRQQESHILDVLLRQQESHKPDSDSRRHMLIKHLVGSASSSHILLRLLQMLDSRGPHDREMRDCAARIMAYLAGEIRLDQFPRGIQCITSLLDTFEEYCLVQPYERDLLLETCEQDWYQEALRLRRSHCRQLQSQGAVAARPDRRSHRRLLQRQGAVAAKPDKREDGGGKLREAYKELLLHGLRILRKLAADEDNCRVMSNTKGLLPKIMAPVTSDLLHRSIQDHGAWSGIVEGSLRVMGRLVTAPGETGAKLRREISSNKEAITTVERILKCAQCGAKAEELHKQAMGILTQLYMDEKYLSMSTESRVNFIKMLLHIFTHDNKDSSIRKLAGEALAMLSSEGGSNATIILQVQGDAVVSLTKVLLHVENKKYRISAARILEHLCIHCTKDDECLKKAMIDAMLKVLGEILGCGLTGEEIHRGKEANPHDDSRDDGRGNRSSSHQQNDEQDEEEFEAALLSALLSLCVTVCDTFISADQDLALHFHAINEFSFLRKLEEMVQRNSDPSHPTAANCLRTMKLTTKMLISMMKHRGSYLQQDLESLMKLLSNASETMSDLDCSMIFASGDHGATTTLASLVKEAQELVGQKKAQELAIVCV